jgi:hypothetical protein
VDCINAMFLRICGCATAITRIASALPLGRESNPCSTHENTNKPLPPLRR